MMSIYFRVFPKNGTAKPAKSWAVMGFPAISTVMAGQRGGYIGTNNTVYKPNNVYIIYNVSIYKPIVLSKKVKRYTLIKGL
jgi:hypothetical protein